MKTLAHLQEYTLTLTALSPVFVGSGDSYQKTEYLFDPSRKLVSFVDKNRFFRFLLENDLTDRYEAFILGPGNKNLSAFLKHTCRLSEEQIGSFTGKSVSAADAIDESHSLKEIQAFAKLPDGRAYIPGSSVKGCLRTVLLTDMLLRDTMLDRTDSSDSKWAEHLEEQYLHTLHCTSKQSNAVNSIMRGLAISDSAPIDEEDMILCGKIDLLINNEENVINVVRQCVAPGTKISFQITLDQSVLKNEITLESIQTAIDCFDSFYRKTYNAKFPQPSAYDTADSFLILGGGSGFFSKNLIYPFYKDTPQKAVKEVSHILSRSFKKHGHENDHNIGISPHTQKLTEYMGEEYALGLCRVELS
ncbi:type III-A CRISPR-associated RAMP protein Csm5 [Butyricicoccus porcorum]|uniref:CRISPR system Cms protein Csm5 n=1 Tax=Butyricicoccus porcorum TaxID=1945634 RepID=A0A252F1V3_9FIRM|nr:type III-A CRISPR-associated RAMP protein Csm5 [Butyricicoccus porcorum]OUM19580.1 type III-A CRISPR-associated RAMP protein Csm5 [Butyricicoccus porcorum]